MAVFNQDNKFNMDMSYREEALNIVSGLIQGKIGRTKPLLYEKLRFESDKETIASDVRKQKHFSESEWFGCLKFFIMSMRNRKQKADLSEYEIGSSPKRTR